MNVYIKDTNEVHVVIYTPIAHLQILGKFPVEFIIVQSDPNAEIKTLSFIK